MVLKSFCPNHEDFGIFARDPDAKDFLTSSVGIAAGLKIQHCFGEDNGLQSCRDIMQSFHSLGGDKGATNKYMRHACGLSETVDKATPVYLHAQQPHAEVPDIPDTQPFRADVISSVKLYEYALHYAKTLLTFEHKQRNGVITYSEITESIFKLMPKPPNSSAYQKPMIWQALLDGDYLIKGRQRKYVFKITMKSADSNFPIAASMERESSAFLWPEQYDAANFIKNTQQATTRIYNLEAMMGAGQQKAKARGRPSAQKNQKQVATPKDTSKYQSWHDKIQALKDDLKYWSSELSSGTASTSSSSLRSAPRSPPSSPKKRVVSKRLLAIEDDSSMKSVKAVYSCRRTWRTRRIADQKSAQTMPQFIQALVLPHTTDFDMVNAMMSLLPQIVRRIGASESEWEDQIKLLDKLALDRTRICEDVLKVSVAVGKRLLINTLLGETLPVQWQSNGFLQRVRRLGVWLRWVSISWNKTRYNVLVNDDTVEWPEASALAHMWMGVEDWIICSCTDLLFEQCMFQHVSLHFDGFRVDNQSLAICATKLRNVVDAQLSDADILINAMQMKVQKKKLAILSSLQLKNIKLYCRALWTLAKAQWLKIFQHFVILMATASS